LGLIDKIYEVENVDTSHTNTFKGFATTMNVQNCFDPNALHIKGDASTFDFSQLKIKAVFFEKIVTIDERIQDKYLQHREENILDVFGNYMGKCIENVSKGMEPGAPLTIEWLPNTTIIEDAFINILTKKNPFNAFVNINAAVQGIFYAEGTTEFLKVLPVSLQPLVLQMAQDVTQRLMFFHEQGVEPSFESFVNRMNAEAAIFQKMLIENCDVFINYNPSLDTTEKLIQSRKVARKVKIKDRGIIGKYKNILDNNNEFISEGYYYDATTFLTESFMNFLLADIMAEKNAPLVIDYIKSIGFKDVTIERKTCEFNNRKNVWMIEAAK
jgi:uncharacterized LabA/DUF88 family protein